MSKAKHKRGFIAQAVYEHLVRPFVESSEPISRISRGAAIGMLVAMTPTVGFQTYIVVVIWFIFRALIRFHFNLPIAVALVWISNPFTVIPMYYVFLVSGELILGLDFSHSMDFETFRQMFSQAENDPAMDMGEALLESVLLLFWRFGWPIVVGSLAWALPLTLVTYPVTTFLMLRYRKLIARREGMTYDEWKKSHIRVD